MSISDYVVTGLIFVVGTICVVTLAPIWIPCAAIGWLAYHTGLAEWLDHRIRP